MAFKLGTKQSSFVTSEDSAGSGTTSPKHKDMVKIRMTREGSIKIIEEDEAEELDIINPTAIPAIRRRALNSPFSHE